MGGPWRDLVACPPRKIRKIRCSEIESEGIFHNIIIFFLGGGGKLECLGRKLPPPPVDRTLGCCNRINNRNYVYLLVLI